VSGAAIDHRRRRWTLVAVCATTFMLLLDISIVVVALPSIQRRFGSGLSGLQWTMDAYALTLAVLILTFGALADRYGRRLIFIFGVVVFTAASALCGAAWSIAVLDVSRAVQGVGGAALFATALALIGHEYRGPERFGAIAIWGATVGAAVASGPLVGGILTDTAGWRWVFFVNIPIGIFALFVAVTRMSESSDPDARHTDVFGLVTFSGSLFMIVLGILRGNAEGWSSPLILGLLIGGAALLGAFVVIEMRQERPMLDITLFGQRAFTGVSIATFCIAAGMFALFPYLSIYLQDILGYSPLGAGLRFLPMTAFIFFVPLLVRRYAAGVSMRTHIGLGFALIAAGLGLMRLLVSSTSSWTALLPGLIVAGIGIGIANPAIAAAALRVVDPARTGMASGISNTFRIGGVAFGIALLGALLENRVSSSLTSTLGHPGHGLANAVSAAGSSPFQGKPALAHAADVAFVDGLEALLLLGVVLLATGAVVGYTFLREPRQAPEPVTEPAS
jgi:EmrB/QacA subfamily drug resistance transporter